MRTSDVSISLGGGEMAAHLAMPDGQARGSVIAIMEIWGVNDTMKALAAEFAEAGFVCLVPDLFWRLEPGVQLSDRNPDDVQKAFDLYYHFDYDAGVADLDEASRFLRAIPEGNGKVAAVGYCLGGKMCFLMCCRTEIDCAVAYYGTYIEHSIKEVGNLSRPFMLHQSLKDRWVQPEVNAFIERKLSPNPNVVIHKYPDAGHAFARKGSETYRESDSALAFERTCEFLHQKKR